METAAFPHNSFIQKVFPKSKAGCCDLPGKGIRKLEPFLSGDLVENLLTGELPPGSITKRVAGDLSASHSCWKSLVPEIHPIMLLIWIRVHHTLELGLVGGGGK